MVTGVETAGLILAILPLIVNQIDAYVQGIETLKVFRDKKYRRQLEEYATGLGTQNTILINTLECALEGVVDDEDELSKLIDDPQGPSWKDPNLQAKLRRKLDRNFDVFVRNTTAVSTHLQYLSHKLGLESLSSMEVLNDANVVKREVMKFRNIFSKSVYSELLTKIGNANSALKTLIDQAHHREESGRERQQLSRPLLKCRAARKHAVNLYNAVIQGDCWKCPCKSVHRAHLRIEPLEDHEQHDQIGTIPKLRMAFSSKTSSHALAPPWQWQEVESIPVAVSAPTIITSASPASGITHPTPKRRKVRFTTALGIPGYLAVPQQVPQATSGCQAIADMCSALRADKGDNTLKGFVSIVEGPNTGQRYDIYLLDKLDATMEIQTLEDLFYRSPFAAGQTIVSRPVSRRARLSLAATLACSVLQYQGSWLKPHWRSRDILLSKAAIESTANFDRFYLSGHKVDRRNSLESQRIVQDVPVTGASPSNGAKDASIAITIGDAAGSEDESPTAITDTTRRTHNLIRCELLFPLGLTLVELSLCQSIPSLRLPEDNDAVEALASLKTAARVLDNVYYESGFRYGDVVDKCLFGLGSNNMDLEDEDFQRAVYEKIVLPLRDDLKNFEGKGPIH
ncbi:hypothetical protein PV11_07012 [Exophiala sideris]|uniref:DUF7580 domain-containing protein n=1 Tax=Exophiala sideris TaxID=1016849 RepID=A0A0D1VTH9_9EURO|nr:hypothetical protein PV11_07012 [Exophiala sideris]